MSSNWKNVTFETNGEVVTDSVTYASLADMLATREPDSVKVVVDLAPAVPDPDGELRMKVLLKYLDDNPSYTLAMAVAESVQREEGDDTEGGGGGGAGGGGKGGAG